MKKELTFILLAMTFAIMSCVKEEAQDIIPPSEAVITKVQQPISDLVANRYYVTKADAKAYVQELSPEAEIVSIEEYVSDGETVAYIVNLNEGWRIISADKRMPPVLAWSDEGSFELEPIAKFGVAEWFDSARENTKNVRADLSVVENENTIAWGMTLVEGSKKSVSKTNSGELLWTKVTTSQKYSGIVSSFGPLLITKWGQQAPWNNLFPVDNQNIISGRVLTGCVAVALSQIMYYYHGLWDVPSGLFENNTSSWTLSSEVLGTYGDYPIYAMKNSLERGDYNSTTTRWDSMKIDNSSSYSGSDKDGYDYVGELMMDIGERVDMDYSYALGSYTSDSLACTSLQYYGLMGDLRTFSDSLAMSEVMSGKALYASGSGAKGRHAFVLDGHKLFRTYTATTVTWLFGYQPGIGEGATQAEAKEFANEHGYEKPEDGMCETTNSDYSFVRYYHINWGWDGTNDGYYTTFNEFNADKKIICNIRVTND